MTEPSKLDLKRRVAEITWFHTIDLGDGVVTPGHLPSEVLAQSGAIPDVRDRSVLDIGAWDGKYAFEAERSGAARVVALDHYVWQLDWTRREAYWRECESAGILPDPAADARFLDSEHLPGRRGFDLARSVLDSRVEPVVADFMSTDLLALGRFDVVLYFGVLYHMREPLTALERLRRVTETVAAIETEAILVPGHEDEPLVALYTANELNRDYTNWYAPSETALIGMCLAAGFRRTETRVGPTAGVTPPASGTVPGNRARRRRGASRSMSLPSPAASSRYRIVVHAFV